MKINESSDYHKQKKSQVTNKLIAEQGIFIGYFKSCVKP